MERADRRCGHRYRGGGYALRILVQSDKAAEAAFGECAAVFSLAQMAAGEREDFGFAIAEAKRVHLVGRQEAAATHGAWRGRGESGLHEPASSRRGLFGQRAIGGMAVDEVEHDGVARVAARFGKAAMDERAFMPHLQDRMQADMPVDLGAPGVGRGGGGAGAAESGAEVIEGGGQSDLFGERGGGREGDE
jgi:hypothetical protein